MNIKDFFNKPNDSLNVRELGADFEYLNTAIEKKIAEYEKTIISLRESVSNLEKRAQDVKEAASRKADQVKKEIAATQDQLEAYAAEVASSSLAGDETKDAVSDEKVRTLSQNVYWLTAKLKAFVNPKIAATASIEEVDRIKALYKEAVLSAQVIYELLRMRGQVLGKIRKIVDQTEKTAAENHSFFRFYDTLNLSTRIGSYLRPVCNVIFDPSLKEPPQQADAIWKFTHPVWQEVLNEAPETVDPIKKKLHLFSK